MAYTFKHGDRPLDDYTIQRAVGSGGFGEVYYAVSDGGREVALKYLKENPHVELRGVGHCINLKSPHLVSIFDVKKNADGDYFIIMEYCSGPSLRDLLIAEPTGFGMQKATFFVREIAKGLAYLHDRGIVHRDLKPGNLFYDDGYVKIGDYGLSKFISVSRHSAQTASVGTVHYMAPEIGSGNYSRGVDIYALGVILYEMLLGKVPFEGSSMAEVLMKHLTAQPELDELPHPFGNVIRKALEKDPNDRFQSVNEMVDELLVVEEVKQSLDGFSVKSLEGAVHMGGGVPSPVPSPNPVRIARDAVPHGAAPPLPLSTLRPDVELTKRVARRLDRVARKLDQKLVKLSGERSRAKRPKRTLPQALSVVDDPPPAPPGSRGRAAVLTAILSIAVGALIFNADGEPTGVAAGMMTAGMVLGLSLARRAVQWFGLSYGRNFSSRVVHAGCCAPFLGIGTIPLLDSTLHSHDAGAIWGGLMLVAMFADWRRHFERKLLGGVSLGSALWVGFGAIIATSIASAAVNIDPDEFVMFSAAVAGMATLIVQSVGVGTAALAGAAAPDSPVAPSKASSPDASDSPNGHVVQAQQGQDHLIEETPMDPLHGHQMTLQARYERWGFTRAFWGVLTFLLVGGTILMCLIAALGRIGCYDDKTGLILGSIACGTCMLFTIRKTTPLKNVGFWREWLRPFLVTVSLFGIGGTTTAIARYWHTSDEIEQAVMITGLIMSSLMFVTVAALRGKRRRPRPPAQFLAGEPAVRESDPNRMDTDCC